MSFLLGQGTGGGTDFKPVPAGVYYAVCCGVFDLGTQRSVFNGKEKWQRKVKLRFEIPTVRVMYEKDGVQINGSAIINSYPYTLSYDSRANLRRDLDAWRGVPFATDEEAKAFDIAHLLGAQAQIQVTHTIKEDKVYANITTMMAMPHGQQVGGAECPLIYYNLEEHGFNFPEGTPESIKEKVYLSKEYQEMQRGLQQPAQQQAAQPTQAPPLQPGQYQSIINPTPAQLAQELQANQSQGAPVQQPQQGQPLFQQMGQQHAAQPVQQQQAPPQQPAQPSLQAGPMTPPFAGNPAAQAPAATPQKQQAQRPGAPANQPGHDPADDVPF